MNIGGHVSTRGGIDKAIDNALAIGAEVIQTHPSPPQTWRHLSLDHASLETYRTRYAEADLKGHFLHAVYLINLATPKDVLLRQSIGSLVHYMELAAELDAAGVVFHPGSHLGAGFEAMLPQMIAAMREVLDRTGSPAKLIVENSAGAGGCVGRGFDEIGAMVAGVGSDRVGVCLDTAHLFASGYDIRDRQNVQTTLAAFDREIGFDRLCVVHANDSRSALGSNVDRHANIGEGEIGRDPFRWLLEDERLRSVPWILEVPGTERSGPDLENINRLRECAGLDPVRMAAPGVAVGVTAAGEKAAQTSV